MIRLLMLDLGKTLIDDGQPFPNVVDALGAISAFTTEDGEPLILAIVSDFGEPASTEQATRKSEIEFATILRAAQIERFFQPFSAKVTISARARAEKPKKRIFETAIRRSGIDVPFAGCLFVTEYRPHLAAARDLGLSVLGFGPDVAGFPSFAHWIEAPPIIAEIVTPRSIPNRERALATVLKLDHGIGGFKCLSRDGTTTRGQGTRLLQLQRPELGDLSGVFVEFPVDVEIRSSGLGAIDQVTIGAIEEDDVQEAAAHVGRLARRGQIAADHERPGPGTTHAVTTDDAGRRIVVRQRFAN